MAYIVEHRWTAPLFCFARLCKGQSNPDVGVNEVRSRELQSLFSTIYAIAYDHTLVELAIWANIETECGHYL